ncbi:MAG TPA: transcription antitermination factor NusB [Candidatus Acidoferrales bacterium]|nr:transcription antitermination factor NusB [Candidatus Acidoferrales bacterium]
MGGSRHQARELALQVLFQVDDGLRDVDCEEALAYFGAEAGVENQARAFAQDLVRGVIAHRERLDAAIVEASEHWRLEQMGRVDRTVLRIATYEILIGREVPAKAAINESIELAKTFSGNESGRFVNGVLGRVMESATR